MCTASKPYLEQCTTATDPESAFHRLSLILDTLRQQCPWDKVQTLTSLRYLTIEEVHELSEAIIALDSARVSADETQLHALALQLQKELGDVMMHAMFYGKIASDEGLFTMTDVLNAISDKLIDRHPFIYQHDAYHGESWEELKMREGRRGVLDGVPDSLPSMVKAIRMQEKVAGMSDTTSTPPHFADDACITLDPQMSVDDFGQLLFDLIDWAQQHGINADDALSHANYNFRQQHSSE